jgi:hypothetical protein
MESASRRPMGQRSSRESFWWQIRGHLGRFLQPERLAMHIASL